MNEYIPSPSQWIAEQVELYEGSGGAKGTTLNGLSVIIVINRGRRIGGIRKTPLTRVADRDKHILVASLGGAPKYPLWCHNLKADPSVEIWDEAEDSVERRRLWDIAVEAYPPYQDDQEKTDRVSRSS